MADACSSITFVLDENSAGFVPALRATRATAHARVTDLPALGIAPGTLDVPLLDELGRKGSYALITRDGRMLEPLLQRQAWRSAGVTVFLLGKKWGGLPLGEAMRRFLFLWPSMVGHAEAGGLGLAWRVSHAVPDPAGNAFRLVTGRQDGNE